MVYETVPRCGWCGGNLVIDAESHLALELALGHVCLALAVRHALQTSLHCVELRPTSCPVGCATLNTPSLVSALTLLTGTPASMRGGHRKRNTGIETVD